MRKIVCLALLLSGFTLWAQSPTSAAAAQSQPSPNETQAPVLRSETSVVLVDVVATDKDKPATGLPQNRFHVFENGHEQRIDFFEEHRPARPDAVPRPLVLPPHVYTNIPLAPPSAAINVLLLDGLNTLGDDQIEVRRQMLAYLAKLDPGAPMAVFTMASQLKMVQGFTTDIGELTGAIKKSRILLAQTSSAGDLNAVNTVSIPDEEISHSAAPAPNGSTTSSGPDPHAAMDDAMKQFVTEMKSFQTDTRVNLTLDALRQLARFLSAVPSRKNLIWFSGSFPLQIGPDMTLRNSMAGIRNYAEQLRATSAMLAAARVAVYPVDARGMMGLPLYDSSMDTNSEMQGATPRINVVDPMGGQNRGPVNLRPGYSAQEDIVTKMLSSQDSMRELAESTGGKAFINTNGLKEAFADAASTGESYYTLSYSPKNHKFDGEFRRIKVTIDGTSAKLAYRTGYYAEPLDKPAKDALKSADLLRASSLHGAPPSTQILFKAVVEPVEDAAMKEAELDKNQAGEPAVKSKENGHRESVELTIDPHGLSFQGQADGKRGASVEFAVLAYDRDGNRVNYLDRVVQIAFTPERFQYVMANGYTARIVINAPKDAASLRIVVHDMDSQRAGSLEVPLTSE